MKPRFAHIFSKNWEVERLTANFKKQKILPNEKYLKFSENLCPEKYKSAG